MPARPSFGRSCVVLRSTVGGASARRVRLAGSSPQRRPPARRVGVDAVTDVIGQRAASLAAAAAPSLPELPTWSRAASPGQIRLISDGTPGRRRGLLDADQGCPWVGDPRQDARATRRRLRIPAAVALNAAGGAGWGGGRHGTDRQRQASRWAPGSLDGRGRGGTDPGGLGGDLVAGRPAKLRSSPQACDHGGTSWWRGGGRGRGGCGRGAGGGRADRPHGPALAAHGGCAEPGGVLGGAGLRYWAAWPAIDLFFIGPLGLPLLVYALLRIPPYDPPPRR